MKQVKEFIPIRFRSGFNDDGVAAGAAAALVCDDISLTVQADREAADINTIMSRYTQTAVAPQLVRVPVEGDFDDIFDFRDAMAAVRAAQESFAALPPNLRQRFDHDPAAFHDFCVDPANLPELRALGLAVPAPEAPAAPSPSPPETE